MRPHLATLMCLMLLSPFAVAQESEPPETPDALDTTQPPEFPAPIEIPGPLSEQERLLVAAAHRGDLAQVQGLLAKGIDVDVRDQKQRTPLIFAANNGHTAVVALLLEQGAEVDAKESGGRTALWYAVRRSFNETAVLLLSKGADADVRSSKRGITPLMLAAVWNNVEIAEMLLDRGADPNQVDVFGRTARLQAERRGNSEVLALLPEPAPQETE